MLNSSLPLENRANIKREMEDMMDKISRDIHKVHQKVLADTGAKKLKEDTAHLKSEMEAYL